MSVDKEKRDIKLSEKMEDWFLGQFMPIFFTITHLIGYLAIFYGISFILALILPYPGHPDFHTAVTYMPAVVLGCYFSYWGLKKKQRDRYIPQLIETEEDRISQCFQDKNAYLFNKIVLTIMDELDRQGFISFVERDDNALCDKVSNAVWEKYQSLQNSKEPKKEVSKVNLPPPLILRGHWLNPQNIEQEKEWHRKYGLSNHRLAQYQLKKLQQKNQQQENQQEKPEKRK